LSRIQEKESGLLNNLSSSEIANELDSRLRDLEKNLSVAREFIKLADESYSELRHKWNLLQEEARNKPQTFSTKEETMTDEKTDTTTGKRQHSRNKPKASASATGMGETSSMNTPNLEARSHKTKTTNQPSKEPAITSEFDSSSDNEKTSRQSHYQDRKHGKSAGHHSKSSPT